MGIEVNSRGRCRRFKLSRMIRRETQEEISNRVRHPSLTISCVRPGVIAGGRGDPGGPGGRERRRGIKPLQRRVCIRWIAPALSPGLRGWGRVSASVWAPDGSRSSFVFRTCSPCRIRRMLGRYRWREAGLVGRPRKRREFSKITESSWRGGSFTFSSDSQFRSVFWYFVSLLYTERKESI